MKKCSRGEKNTNFAVLSAINDLKTFPLACSSSRSMLLEIRYERFLLPVSAAGISKEQCLLFSELCRVRLYDG